MKCVLELTPGERVYDNALGYLFYSGIYKSTGSDNNHVAVFISEDDPRKGRISLRNALVPTDASDWKLNRHLVWQDPLSG